MNTARLPDFSRRNVQHVERNSDALALVLLADLLERCRLQRAVNRDQIMLVVHFDAVSCRDLHELSCKEGDAENDRRVDIVIQAAIFQDAPVLKMIGGKVDDLLWCARTFERERRLSEQCLAAGLQPLQAIPGVGHMLG